MKSKEKEKDPNLLSNKREREDQNSGKDIKKSRWGEVKLFNEICRKLIKRLRLSKKKEKREKIMIKSTKDQQKSKLEHKLVLRIDYLYLLNHS